jgi:L-alanine-DL-glutamate epimerase-like enolase superfamily enzyme
VVKYICHGAVLLAVSKRANFCNTQSQNREAPAMKVKDLKVFIVGNPPPGWGGRYFIFVKLTTDNGIVGYGECYCATFGPKAMTAMIEDTFQRYVEGIDPFHNTVAQSLWLWLHPAS